MIALRSSGFAPSLEARKQEEPVAGSLGGRIRQARRGAGLLQRELAARLEPPVSAETVRKWETGGRTPRLNHLRAVAVAVGRPVAWFLNGEVS